MSDQLIVKNDGPLIVETNYWSTEMNARGLFLLSPNDGVFRLLIPVGMEQVFLRETWRASEVIVSRGPWPAERLPDAIEVLFEDGSSDPFALHLDARQCVPLVAAGDDGRAVPVHLWTRQRGKPRKVREYPGRFRVVPQIPWLKKWGVS